MIDRVLGNRLRNQKLTADWRDSAAALVGWLGAVQSQDFVGAKWALGLRASGLDDGAIERAFNAGHILRTHVMRPTWHFVTPQDIRWMLELTGPRVRAINRGYAYTSGLTDRLLARGRTVVERALEGGAHLTRQDLRLALHSARVDIVGPQLGFLLIDLEVQGVICSGPLEQKQFTYALISERAPRARSLSREEALAELARRFFQSHGPATLRDFAWWSGLTMGDVKQATLLAGVDVLAAPPALDVSRGATYLLSNYDEYLIAYQDRGAVIAPGRSRSMGVFVGEHPHQLVVDGRVAGSWRRTISARTLVVEARAYDKLSRAQRQAVLAQAERYGQFLGLAAEVRFDG
jgi:hypothetical protein